MTVSSDLNQAHGTSGNLLLDLIVAASINLYSPASRVVNPSL